MKGCAFNRCGDCFWAQSTTPKCYSKIQIGVSAFAAAVATTAIVMSILLICIQQGCDIPGLNSIASTIDPTWLYVGLSVAAVIDGAILVAAVRSYLNRAPIAPIKKSSSSEETKSASNETPAPSSALPQKQDLYVTDEFFSANFSSDYLAHLKIYGQGLKGKEYAAFDLSDEDKSISVFTLVYNKVSETAAQASDLQIIHFTTQESRQKFIQELGEDYSNSIARITDEEYPPALEKLIFSPAVREDTLLNDDTLPGEFIYFTDATKETTIGALVFYVVVNKGTEKIIRFFKTEAARNSAYQALEQTGNTNAVVRNRNEQHAALAVTAELRADTPTPVYVIFRHKAVGWAHLVIIKPNKKGSSSDSGSK